MTTTRDGLRGGTASVLLRLALGVTFVWAGLGKIFGEATIGPDQAAALAGMGVTVEKSPAAPGAPVSNTPAPAPAPAPAVQPGSTGQDPMPADQFQKPGTAGGPGTGGAGPSPADFTPSTKVRRVHGLALGIRSAAAPAPRADGSRPGALLPAFIGQGGWAVRLAYAVVVAEVVGGAMVLMGLLTRLWAVLIGAVMAAAIWVVQIGPAIQKGGATLGFLPDHALWDMEKWTPLLWNFSLLMIALALALCGPGLLAIDNALFGPSAPSEAIDDA